MVRIVVSGGKLHWLPPDKEKTVYTELVFLFFTNNDQYAREASLRK